MKAKYLLTALLIALTIALVACDGDADPAATTDLSTTNTTTDASTATTVSNTDGSAASTTTVSATSVSTAATASTTAGATIASASFSSTILAAGVPAIWGAALVNVGATVLDHLPHGSFFHATGGSVEMSIKERLRLIPYESLVGLALTGLSLLTYSFMS